MNIALWVVQVILALMFLMAGSMKALQYDRAYATLPWVKDVPRPLVTFIGVAELLGGLGVILPAITGIAPYLTPLAAAGLATVMVLAAIFHTTRREPQSIVFNVILLALAAFVAYGRWLLAPL